MKNTKKKKLPLNRIIALLLIAALGMSALYVLIYILFLR
jgi:hypothetical protein